MHGKATTAQDSRSSEAEVPAPRADWRAQARDLALQKALRKRAAGVPTYSVPEAAALLSISQEHLYRLVRADAFPAVRMRIGGEMGRYVIPAQAVERLLDVTSDGGMHVEAADLAAQWREDRTRGAQHTGGVA